MGMKDLKGYFNKLAAAATNKKLLLEKLFTNNTKLSVTNEELVETVKQISNENKDLQRDTSRLKKTVGSGAKQGKRGPTLCPHCKMECYHSPDACF